jgi:hypothetical protein
VLGRFDAERLDSQYVVKELGFTFVGVQAPAAEPSTLSDDYTFSTLVRHFKVCGDGK